MVVSLLQTKLFVPSLPTELIPRPRLIKRLDERRRLVLVSAPAGFGKTTLVGAWAEALASTSPSPEKLAWLSLDPADDDPVRFWSYVIAALQTVHPDTGESALALLQTPQPPPIATVLTALINEIAALPDRVVLALDDYYLIGAPPIHEALAFLIDHLPSQMRLIILTRADPPLPLARLRVRGQLVELRAADLRFTPDETAAFLNQAMGLDLAAGEVAALEARTEGWIAALQLAAIALQSLPSTQDRDNVPAFVSTFAGSHHYIVDFLVQEVLERQPVQVREFLLKTSILDRLSGSLCDALTGRSDGQATLEALQRANLFVVPLDDQRHWYRYHHLFADMLRSRLEQAFSSQVQGLHRRAAGWYEGAQLPEPAIEHTFAAGDYAQVKHLLRQSYPQWLRPENRARIEQWFELLPSAFLQADPWLCVIWAWLVWGRGQAAEAERYLSFAQQAFDCLQSAGKLPANDPEYDSLPAEILAFKGLVYTRKGDPRQVIELAERALALVPEGASTIQAIAYLDQQVAYRDLGRMDEAIRACRLAIPAARSGAEVGTRVSTLHSLGLNLILLGRLDEAVQVYQDGLRYAETRREVRLPQYSLIYVRLTELSYEKNDLGEADRLLEQGLQMSEKSTYLWPGFYGHILLSRLRLAQGDRPGALDALEQVERLSRRIAGAYFEDELNGYWARLSADLGRLDRAEAWARSAEPCLEESSGYDQVDRVIQLAHILIGLGRLDEGVDLAARIQAVAQTKGYRHCQISMWVLQAIGWWGKGDRVQATQCLEAALLLAEPDGYMRVFLDQGKPMLELLSKARQQGIAPAYVARLISAVLQSAEPSSPMSQPLFEPLSERELEVLHLLAEGKSNREISDALFIAVGTVKKHLSNIFGKMGVRNRTECAAQARELGLV